MTVTELIEALRILPDQNALVATSIPKTDALQPAGKLLVVPVRTGKGVFYPVGFTGGEADRTVVQIT